MPGRGSRKTPGAIGWHLPKARNGYAARPFAYSTAGTLYLIETLAADGITWADLLGATPFDPDAQVIARGFVAAGFGATPISESLGLPSLAPTGSAGR